MSTRRKEVIVRVEPIIVDRPTAAALVALSETSIERQVIAGEFPAPVKLSGNRVGWRYADLVEWAKNLPPSDILPVHQPRKGKP